MVEFPPDYCPRCAGSGRDPGSFGGHRDCSKCNGSGRVTALEGSARCPQCGADWPHHHTRDGQPIPSARPASPPAPEQAPTGEVDQSHRDAAERIVDECIRGYSHDLPASVVRKLAVSFANGLAVYEGLAYAKGLADAAERHRRVVAAGDALARLLSKLGSSSDVADDILEAWDGAKEPGT